MSTEVSPEARSVWPTLALCACAVVLAVLPYRTVLPVYPSGVDVPMWISDFRTDEPEWVFHVFLREHFIAWRPVAALSFTFDSLVPAPMPWGMRATDIAIHVAAGFSLAAAASALSLRRGWAVAAAALFWLSPLNELVVPFVTRRSYSLAACLGLAAVAAAVPALKPHRRVRLAAAMGLMALSELSNETAFVGSPLLILCAVVWSPSWRAVGEFGGLVAVVTGVLVGLRTAILHGVGGYAPEMRLVSAVEAGERVIRKQSTAWEVFVASWRGAVFSEDLAGHVPFPMVEPIAPYVAVGLATWALAVSAHRAWRHRDPLPGLLVTWALGYALVAVLGHVWFPRMSYAMGAPVSLWLVYVVHCTVRSTHRAAWANLVPIALLLAGRLAVAPPPSGLDRSELREQAWASRAIRRLQPALASVEGPALVWVAAGVGFPELESLVVHLRDSAGPGVQLRPLAHLQGTTPRDQPAVLVREQGSVRPAPGARWAASLRRAPTPDATLSLDDLVDPVLPTWLLDQGAVTRLPPQVP